jgi:hypothetical protein
MGTWTIQYSGTEKSAAAWGLTAAPVWRARTQAAQQFSFQMPGADPAGASPFPFEAQVIIRQNRTGGGTAWTNDASANHFVFQGRLISPVGNVSGSRQDITLVFQDAWYDLENIPFQQLWDIYGGTAYFSRAYLFYNPGPTPSYLTVAQQLANIITFAAGAGANIQAGTITSTSGTSGASEMPWYAVRGLSCAAAIKKCLECFPDLIVWIDGSTTPPSFNCVPRASLTSISLPYKGTDAHGRAHLSSQIKPRYDLAPSQVVLQYQQVISSGATSAVELSTEVYPSGSTGMALRALVCPIDLRGGSASFAKTQIVTQAFDPTQVAAFWQTHVKSLKDSDIVGTPAIVDTTINSGSTYGISVVDSTGAAINYATYYPVEMIRPSKWASWTGVNVIEATVSAYLSYSKAKKVGAASSARTTDKITQHLHTVKIKLCNAPLGATNYVTETAYNSGESPVSGLAQTIYNSLTQLQYEGAHEIIEQTSVWQVIGPWNVLNLTGGATAWATMNAALPEVEIDFLRNQTRLTIGPARHLAPQDLNNYLQFFRQRVMWDNAQISSGTVTGAAIDQSGDAPEEDSNSGQPQQSTKEMRDADPNVAGNTNVVTIDPVNGQISTGQFNSSGTSLVSSIIPPVYQGAGAPSATTLPAGTYYRANWLYLNTSASPAQLYYCSTAGTNSASAWTAIGGSGGGGGYAGTYTNATAYSVGNIVRVETTATSSGTTATLGVFGCINATTANAGGNEVPQFPEPTTGTKYWQLIALGVNAISTCSGSGAGTIYIQSSSTF